MEMTVKLVIDASPNLEKLVTWLVSKTQPTAVLTETKADTPAAPIAEQQEKKPSAQVQASAPTPAPAPAAEAKPKEISDADMREVVGPFVQANGADKIIALLKELGVNTNRTTDLPQEKRQEFIDKIKAMM